MGGSYERMGGSMSYGGWCSKSDYNEFKDNEFKDNQTGSTPDKTVFRQSIPYLTPYKFSPKRRINYKSSDRPKNPLFTFGKYKGYDINSVNEFDPEYIKWISLWITEKKYGKIFYDSIKKRILKIQHTSNN